MNLEALKQAILRRRGKDMDMSIFEEGGEVPAIEGIEETLGVEGQDGEEAAMEKDLAPETQGEAGMLDDKNVDPEQMAAGGSDAISPEAIEALLALLDGHGKSPMREKMMAMKAGK